VGWKKTTYVVPVKVCPIVRVPFTGPGETEETDDFPWRMFRMFPASTPGLNVELKLSGPLKMDVDVEGVVNPPITVTAPTMFEVPDILAVLTKVVAKLDVPEMFALVMKVAPKLDVPETFALVMTVAPKLDVLETFKVVETTKGTVSVL
jgi:hypothetical protein